MRTPGILSYYITYQHLVSEELCNLLMFLEADIPNKVLKALLFFCYFLMKQPKKAAMILSYHII